MCIAICDDECKYINIVEAFLDKLKEEYKNIEWDIFKSGEELLQYYQQNDINHDVVLLDMEMKKLNGIDTANIIRQKDRHIIIIFITNHTKYMQKSFECSPFRFLVKPVNFEDFSNVFSAVLIKLEEERKTFIFTENRIRVRLFCDDILFFESQSHWVYIHTKEKQYKILKSFSILESKLDSTVFTKIHKSFIINLGHIKEICNNNVFLYNYDMPIPISRNYKKVLVDKFFEFKERKYFI